MKSSFYPNPPTDRIPNPNPMDIRVKRLLKASLIVFLAGTGTVPALAQSTRQAMKKADKFFKDENYRASIPFYEQVLAKEPDNALAYLRAGISYMSFDKEKASDYIYKAQRLKPKVAKDIDYWLGRVDHINYNFDDAITHYQSAQTTMKKSDPRREEIALRIQHSKNAKVQFNTPKDIFIKNLGPVINTIASEHSPVISQDDKLLIYTSRGSNVTGANTKKGVATDGEYFEDIFEARKLGDDQWDTPRSLSGVLNGKGHDASIQLFDSDSKLLMYRQDEDGDIFYTQKESGEWTQPIKLNKNINTKRFQSDAHITPDGLTMYFSTTEFSDNNTLDIYYSTRTAGGDWGPAKSVGSTVNTTEYDEDSPYLSRDGKTLFFASRGHDTMGGYDIFKSAWDEGSKRWGKPVNMGYPINTPDDDSYYRLSADGSYAYLSSYRIGGYGEKDIYTINYIKNVIIKGRVFQLNDSSAVPGAELVFNSQSADKKAITFRDVTKVGEGDYSVTVLSGRTYQVNVSKDGKLITSEALEVPMVTQDSAAPIVKNFFIPYVDSAAYYVKHPKVVEDKNFHNIYYTTDQFDLRPESITELDKIAKVLKDNPKVNLSIEGHTDKRNSDAYNMTLGKNRAVAAYQYLTKSGIAAKRLVTISYGEKRPAVPNQDTEENMQLNRRDEFRVILKPGQSLKDLNLESATSTPGKPTMDATNQRLNPGQKGRQKKK